MSAKLNGVAICIASSGRPVNLKWAVNFSSIPQNGPVGMSVGILCTEGLDRAQNREKLVEQALKLEAPYVFFIDDDTVCPNFTLRWLHAAISKDPKAMVCGGIYCTKTDPPEPIVFEKMGGGPFYNWKIGDVFECAGIGCGCMLIRTEVFKHISKPWFFEPDECYVDREDGVSASKGTDDLYFCKKVTDAGFKVIAHGGVLPVHLDLDGKLYTLPLDSYPCQGTSLKELKQ